MRNILLKNNIPVQKYFEGNGAIYHGYAGFPDECGRVYSQELCDEEARRIENMRLKIARTFYGWWAWDEKTDTWDWDNEKMTAFYGWLTRMKKAGVSVALNTGWCSPGDINSTSWNGKSPFTVEGDWKKSCENFGDWVSETYYQLVEKRGFTNIKYFVMFTEPQRYSGKASIEGQTPYECWHDATRAAHNALVRDGRRDKIIIMGPQNGSTADSHMMGWAVQNASDILDIYSSHNYQWVPAITDKYIKSGKTSMTMTVFWSRAFQRVALKPNTDYEAVIEMLYESDFEQEGGYVFGVYQDTDAHDPLCHGPLPSVAEGSTRTITPDELSREYKKISIRFNSGDATSGILGIFTALKAPAVLEGKTIPFTEHKGKTVGIAYINSISLFDVNTGENIAVDPDFSEEYAHWTPSTTAGGIKEPYYDWCKWVKTALDMIPGEENNKPYCYDEYNICYSRDNARLEYGAETVDSAVALMNSGVRSTLLWTLFDQQWPDNHSTNHDSFVDGDHRCGSMPILTRSLVPHLGFYAITLLSRYVEAGSQIYEGVGDNNVHATMAVSPKGEVTIVVVNRKAESDEFNMQFENALCKTLNRHLFDPNELTPDEKASVLGIDKVYTNVENTLTDTLPPFSVAVYTTFTD